MKKYIQNINRSWTPDQYRILGRYDRRNFTLRRFDGKVYSLSRGTQISHQEQTVTQNRTLQIEGRRFSVSSVFPSAPSQTPTGKLLSLIDTDLEGGLIQ